MELIIQTLVSLIILVGLSLNVANAHTLDVSNQASKNTVKIIHHQVTQALKTTTKPKA